MKAFIFKLLGGVIGAVVGGSVSFLIGGLDRSVFVVAIIGAYIGYTGSSGFSSESNEEM